MQAPLYPPQAEGVVGSQAKQSQSITFLPCSPVSAEKEKSLSHLKLFSTYADKTAPCAGHLFHFMKPITCLCHGD